MYGIPRCLWNLRRPRRCRLHKRHSPLRVSAMPRNHSQGLKSHKQLCLKALLRRGFLSGKQRAKLQFEWHVSAKVTFEKKTTKKTITKVDPWRNAKAFNKFPLPVSEERSWQLTRCGGTEWNLFRTDVSIFKKVTWNEQMFRLQRLAVQCITLQRELGAALPPRRRFFWGFYYQAVVLHSDDPSVALITVDY